MSNIYINKKMIEYGIMSKAIIPKLDKDGLKAYVGESWFYFGGNEFEYTEPDDIPFQILVEEIKMVLDYFAILPEYENMYYDYYYYLYANI